MDSFLPWVEELNLKFDKTGDAFELWETVEISWLLCYSS